MSLFEKLKNKRYDLQEKKKTTSSSASSGNNKSNENISTGRSRIRKAISDLDATQPKPIETGKTTYSKNKNVSQDIGQRRTAQSNQQQLFNRQYDAYDDGDLGNPSQSKSQTSSKVTTGAGGTTATKTKTVKQSEVSKQAKDFTKKINKKRTGGFEDVTGEGKVKYPKTRKELIAKRKEYGIDREGNISDAGVKRYAQKTKQLSSGSNLPVTPTQKELNLAKKRAVGGTHIKNKQFGTVIGTTTGKYGGFLSRKKSSKAPSSAQIKAKIDAKNPTYKSPISGGQLPLKKTRSPVDTFLNKIKKYSKQDPEGLKKAVNKFPDFPERKLPRTVLTKTKASKAFPLGLKPVDTKTKEGEKIAKRVTKKFVTDKELMTGFPPETKPPKSPKSPKSPKPSLFTRAKKVLKGFHKFMVKDAGFRKTSGSGRLKKDVLGQIARDRNMTRNVFKNTIRGNTFRAINKALPGKYKALAALATGTYLATRPKKNGAGGGKKDEKKVYDAYQKTLGFDTGKKKQP